MRRREIGWRSLRNQPTSPPPQPAAPATPTPQVAGDGGASPSDAPPPTSGRRTGATGRGGRANAASRQTGRRGGATRGAAAPTAATASATALATDPVSGAPTYDLAFKGSPLKGVEWSISLVGFLVYVYVITTYVVPIGDVAMVIALIGLFFIFDHINVPTMLWLMAGCVIWSAMSYTTTDYPWLVGTSVKDFAKLWLIVLVAVSVLNTRANVRLFMIVFLGGFALYPTRGAIINYLTGNTLFGRAIWNHIYANPNDLAALALLQLSMAFGLFRLEREKWVRWCAMLGIAMMPFLVLMTQSRGAFIALAVYMLAMLAAQRRRVRSFAIAALVGAVVAMAAPRGVWERVGALTHAASTESLDQADTEGSARQRWEIWRVAGRIIEDHPIMGVGKGAYPQVHAEYASTRPGLARTARGKRDTHSTYLNLAAELGFPGLFLFLALVGWTLYKAERTRRRVSALMPETSMQLFSVEMGLLAMLVAGLWGSFASISFLYIHLALVTALTRLAEQDAKAIASGARPSTGLAHGAAPNLRGSRPTPRARRLAPGSGGGGVAAAADSAGGNNGAQPAY